MSAGTKSLMRNRLNCSYGMGSISFLFQALLNQSRVKTLSNFETLNWSEEVAITKTGCEYTRDDLGCISG